MTLTEKSTAIPIEAGAASDCLLVVDDMEANISSLNSMLGKLGFTIIPASHGAQAIERLSTHSPDLILLNLHMSGMNGLELCRRIQESPGGVDIPIIFFSATNDKSQLVQALESGGADYLAQPFDKAELLSRIRTHLMLKTARDHLKQLAAEKEELLNMISHYLQNQLAAMNICSGLLVDQAKDTDNPKLRLFAENIWSASNQMRMFVKTLLANAAVDRNLKINPELVDFSAVAMRSVRQYEEAARAKELTLVTTPLDDGAVIQADPAALSQVLDNLVSNAIKFSPPGRKVSVLMSRHGGEVECHVCDEGPGFTEEDKARMFHRYMRLSAQPTAGEPSTGLGLSIAKKLALAMRGELTCRSDFGRGATFILRFPIADPVS